MMKPFTFWGFILAVLMVAGGCKKNSDDASIDDINGTYQCFEAEFDGEVHSLPAEGLSIKITVNKKGQNEATVQVVSYENGKPKSFPAEDCTISTDADGFLVLTAVSTKKMYAIFYDKETLDVYPATGTRFSASRNGKKPDWWD